MAIIKKGVFIASRFEEFAELRAALAQRIAAFRYGSLEVIDMNDGRAGPQPPLEDCLAAVRRSDFMILLVGDSYGGNAPGHDRSFTQLEYEEARRQPDLRIIPFFVGASYRDRRIAFSEDTRFADWQKALQDQHTVGYIDDGTSVEQACETIALSLEESLWNAIQLESATAAAASKDEDDEPSLDDEAEVLGSVGVDEDEIARLSQAGAEEQGQDFMDLEEVRDEAELMRRPNAVAALEHRAEAMRAVQLGMHSAALSHLKRAVRLRPLDMLARYWTARLLLMLDRKPDFPEAQRHALQAARIAGAEQQTIRSAAAYILAAQAAARQGHHDEGLAYAQQAGEIAPGYSRTFIEIARQHALRGEKSAAIKHIRRAFSIYSPSIGDVLRDPAFRGMRDVLDEFVRERKNHLRRQVEQLDAVAQRIRELAAEAGITLPEPAAAADADSMRLPALVRRCRAQMMRLRDEIAAMLAHYNQRQDALEGGGRPEQHGRLRTIRFGFRDAKGFHIVQWLKEPGDPVRIDEPIFRYRWEDSQHIRDYVVMHDWQCGYFYRACAPGGARRHTDDNDLFVVSDREIIPARASERQEMERDLDAARQKLAEEEAAVGSGNTMLRWRRFLLICSLVGIAGFSFLALTELDPSWIWWAAAGLCAASGLGNLVRIRQLNSAEARRQQRIEAARRERDDKARKLETAHSEVQAAANALREAALVFEKSALTRFQGSLSPYRGVRNAPAGRIVRIARPLAEESRRTGITLQRAEEPEAEALLDDSAPAKLYRVIERNDSSMLLSRLRAYRDD